MFKINCVGLFYISFCYLILKTVKISDSYDDLDKRKILNLEIPQTFVWDSGAHPTGAHIPGTVTVRQLSWISFCNLILLSVMDFNFIHFFLILGDIIYLQTTRK